MLIRSRAPLRLSFGGGGTDLSPYCDQYGGCIVNATINKYAYTTIQVRDDNKIEFIAADRDIICVYHVDDIFSLNSKLPLHVSTYLYFMKMYNKGKRIALTLTTYSDVLPGSGLGSSSTLVVAMVKALSELLQSSLTNYQVAELAHQIERIDVGLNGGKQDSYAAAFGGFNFIEFNPDKTVIVNPLKINNWILCELESSLLLYYTGLSRSSAHIIDEQTKNIKNNVTKSMEGMHQLKKDAQLMKESIMSGNFKNFGECLDNSWQSKKQTAVSITNDYIDEIYHVAKKAGSIACKISGAGGGGFMMLYVPPTKRASVINALQQFDGFFYNCHFANKGSETWRI